MIPSRPSKPPDGPKKTESIPDRLARLRAEQRRSAFNRSSSLLRNHRSPQASPSSALPDRISPGNVASITYLDSYRYNASSNSLVHNSIEPQYGPTRPDQRRAAVPLAGPPAPKSWRTLTGLNSSDQVDDGDDENTTFTNWISVNHQRGMKKQSMRRELNRRNRLLDSFRDTTLDSSSATSTFGSLNSEVPRFPSLQVICAQVLSLDLSLPSIESRNLSVVHLLPGHLKLRLLESWCAACGARLGEEAIVQLLKPVDDREEERLAIEDESSESSASDDLGLADSKAAIAEDSDDWESIDEMTRAFKQPTHLSIWSETSATYSFQAITILNLAFSTVDAEFLRALLLSDYSVTHFPNLHTLNLTSMLRLEPSDTLLGTLKTLYSLQHLSLTGNLLVDRENASPSFLRLLPSVVPNLISLDLSYCANGDRLFNQFLRYDWNKQWLSLIKVGLRSTPVMTIEEYNMPKGARVKRIRDTVARVGARSRARIWIDVFL